MSPAGILEFITRRRAESDPDFRSEIDRLSQRGLRVIGFVEIGLTISGIALWRSGNLPFPVETRPRSWATAIFLTLGLVALLVSRKPALIRHMRSIALAIGLTTALMMTIVDLIVMRQYAYLASSLDLLTVMMVAIAAIPQTPLQVAVLGSGAVAFNSIANSLAFRWGWLPSYDPILGPFIILTALCTLLAGVNHNRIYATWKAHRDALQAAEVLRKAELRTCFAENASTTLRLAAALTHELNTPLGALKSSVDTIVKIAERLPTLPAERQAATAATLPQLTAVIMHAITRLQNVVHRVQRFTNLDEAAVREIDLRQLIEDVIALHSSHDDRKIPIELDIQNVPRFEVAPQALSGVLTPLLNRALGAAGTDGAVRIQASIEEHLLRIGIEQTGTASAFEGASFEPAFQVQNGRIGAANWDLFSARQLILTHGGDITADSVNRVNVELPVILPKRLSGIPNTGIAN